MLTSKNAKAWAVLAIVYDQLSGEGEKDIAIEPYLNGRESGFSITRYRGSAPKVAFSENRNSDQIVVYTGQSSNFSMQGNVPSDHIYKEAQYFEPNDYVGAARTVLEYLDIEHYLPITK